AEIPGPHLRADERRRGFAGTRARSAVAFDEASRGPRPHTLRSTIFLLIDAIAFAGLRCFGQVSAQFMMVWQR
ncbi:MAG: hypothetical protein QOC56_1427, partial [Alphaproteobacteria bacterium]|nr:hypothetical protein [Alphaproteobacteria bacterium]